MRQMVQGSNQKVWKWVVERRGEGSARFFFFFSVLLNLQILSRAKKVQKKKGGHVRGKTQGGFSFFFPSSAPFCICTTYVWKLRHMVAWGGLPANHGEGGWCPPSPWLAEDEAVLIGNKWGCVSGQGLHPSKAVSSTGQWVLQRTNPNPLFR